MAAGTNIFSPCRTYVLINSAIIKQQRSVSIFIACRMPIEVPMHDTTVLRLARDDSLFYGSPGNGIAHPKLYSSSIYTDESYVATVVAICSINGLS